MPTITPGSNTGSGASAQIAGGDFFGAFSLTTGSGVTGVGSDINIDYGGAYISGAQSFHIVPSNLAAMGLTIGNCSCGVRGPGGNSQGFYLSMAYLSSNTEYCFAYYVS